MTNAFVQQAEHWISVRGDTEGVGAKWVRLAEYLESGFPLGTKAEAYVEIGAKIKKDSPCIFVDRSTEASRIPHVQMRFGRDRVRISIRTLLYMGAFRRIAMLHQVPICRNKNCIHPHHQNEYGFEIGSSQPKINMTIAARPRDAQSMKVLKEEHMQGTPLLVAE